jgi:hypothetical protein
MQKLLSMILSSEMQRPSSAKLWQMPHAEAFPMPPFVLLRWVPLEAHDTSYLAAPANIFSFSRLVSKIITVCFIDSHLIKGVQTR